MLNYFSKPSIELFLTYKFIRLLVTPWKKTEAFKAGVVDKKGKLLVKGENQSSAQKKVYTLFTKLVFNLKRILEKVPFGKTAIGSYAAALFLIKENTDMAEEDILKVLTNKQWQKPIRPI